MRRALSVASVVVLVALGHGAALADVSGSNASNVQDGDNSVTGQQIGGSSSGDAVGGQVTGIVSSGDASIDAKNRTEDADVTSGAATGTNSASTFVGAARTEGTGELGMVVVSDVEDSCTGSAGCFNAQDGSNDLEFTQTVTATSGDAVAGQVIGAVLSGSGSADITADNRSEDIDIEGGAATADNDVSAFVGLTSNTGSLVVFASDVADSCGGAAGCANVQDGDNDAVVSQTTDASSGDSVAGQVIGAVSAGDTSIDAKNRSEDVGVGTGEATAHNASAIMTGLATSFVENFVDSADVDGSCRGTGGCANVQEGDDSNDVSQSSTASTGDGVAGQVIGSVTSVGGSADITADNASEDVDIDTGEADAVNLASPFTGLGTATLGNIVGADVTDSCGGGGACNNVQSGDNDATIAQAADSSSGDAVGGQVIGSVSAGDTSIDAKNRSEDADVVSGNADALNSSAAQTGLSNALLFDLVDASVADVDDACGGGGSCANVQDGDNTSSMTQTASANSGDGVGGQVIGSVTSSSGSADIVADNGSEDVDVETGVAEAANAGAQDAGHVVSFLFDTVTAFTAADVTDSCGGDGACENVQDGDNDVSLDQASDASSGDSVAGQVIGSVSAGDTSIDAKNRSEDAGLVTGEADAGNSAAAFAGLNKSLHFSVAAADVDGACGGDGNLCSNVQDGSNEIVLTQQASASSGDAVGGSVIGSVTAASGSSDITADNRSEDVDAETGNGIADNNAATFAGLNDGPTSTVAAGARAADVTDSCDDGGCTNIQDGDNDITGSQSASASSGDTVGGQVLGVVSAGDASLDAKNRSEDVGLGSGESRSTNNASIFAGLGASTLAEVGASDVGDSASAPNILDGDNESTFTQGATSESGDAVGGQVFGIVTSAGGSADGVIDNASEDVDAGSGEDTFTNELSDFVGLSFATDTLVVG